MRPGGTPSRTSSAVMPRGFVVAPVVRMAADQQPLRLARPEERRGLAPLRWGYALPEQILRSVDLADNVTAVARKR